MCPRLRHCRRLPVADSISRSIGLRVGVQFPSQPPSLLSTPDQRATRSASPKWSDTVPQNPRTERSISAELISRYEHPNVDKRTLFSYAGGCKRNGRCLLTSHLYFFEGRKGEAIIQPMARALPRTNESVKSFSRYLQLSHNSFPTSDARYPAAANGRCHGSNRIMRVR